MGGGRVALALKFAQHFLQRRIGGFAVEQRGEGGSSHLRVAGACQLAAGVAQRLVFALKMLLADSRLHEAQEGADFFECFARLVDRGMRDGLAFQLADCLLELLPHDSPHACGERLVLLKSIRHQARGAALSAQGFRKDLRSPGRLPSS